MFKCIGICSKCGRCESAAMMSGANDRKTKMITYPDDFVVKRNGRGFGAAFDIGTTTVVGMLWDLQEGKQICAYAKTNPQNEFGMDVISRIAFCDQNEGNLDVLRKRIIDCLNEIIKELCEKAQIPKDRIYDAAVCGNTTMSHVFAGYSPKALAQLPFLPAYEGILRLSQKEAGLHINESGVVTVVPNIAGHVGGDITAGLVAARILDRNELTIYIDIGTNGEIVLTDGNVSYACSTAAGPAFEGAAIKCGMRAAAGAIEKVDITEDGAVFFKSIGGCEPQGICGSGLIDAIAQMLKRGVIAKSGKLLSAEDAERKGMPANFRERLVKTAEGKAFILVSKARGEDIVITQQDIREVQLAKGAILAGIRLMLAEMGKEPDDIQSLIIAGAFGNYIDKESAMAIGLFPKLDIGKIFCVGNAAGVGVSMVLAGEQELEKAQQLPQKIIHIELAAKENFQNIYSMAMSF